MFKEFYFDLGWAVCNILDCGSPRVIAGHSAGPFTQEGPRICKLKYRLSSRR